MQLDLFEDKIQEKVEKEEKHRYPWLTSWPGWMPAVGEMAEMGCVILEGYGYVHMDWVRVLSIDGDDVVVITDFKSDYMDWKDKREYKCKIWHLWPPVYHKNRLAAEKEHELWLQKQKEDGKGQ